MNRLVTYVSAIHDLSSPAQIVRRTADTDRWLDQGFEVVMDVTTYWFDNGVVVRRTTEKDSFPSDLACAECLIAYEVVSHGDIEGRISPPRKDFENACRKAFWLAYHRA